MKRAVLAFAFLLVSIASASALPSCMSRSEARSNFPASHIYWHGADRCWDTHPARQRHANARHHHHERAERQEPAREAAAPIPRPRPAEALPSFSERWEERVSASYDFDWASKAAGGWHGH